MKFIKDKIYRIEWQDIQTDDRWTEINDFEKEFKKMSEEKFDYIGQFIKEDDKYYVFSSGRHYRESGGAYFAFTIFPKGTVLRSKELTIK